MITGKEKIHKLIDKLIDRGYLSNCMSLCPQTYGFKSLGKEDDIYPDCDKNNIDCNDCWKYAIESDYEE